MNIYQALISMVLVFLMFFDLKKKTLMMSSG